MFNAWRKVGFACLILTIGCAPAAAKPPVTSTTAPAASSIRQALLSLVPSTSTSTSSTTTAPVETTFPEPTTTSTGVASIASVDGLDAGQLAALEAIGWNAEELPTEVLSEQLTPDPDLASVRLARGLYDGMLARLPEPQVRFSQSPTAIRSGSEVSFWVLTGSTRLSPAERYEGPDGATLVALSAKATFDPGNGDAPVVCDRVPSGGGQCRFTYPAVPPGAEPVEYTATVSVTWTFWYTTTDKVNGTFAHADAFTAVTMKVLSPPGG